MIEPKVIEKFMEENGLEPYDAFDVDGEFKPCNPLYFNEDLEVRSMELDSRNLEFFGGKICLYRLLTGQYHVKQKRTKDKKSEVVAEEKRNVVCKVSVKGYVMSDEELDCLKKACCVASNVAFENDEKNIYRKLNEYLITGERSYDRK
ncbi:hypothetical protein [Holdemanella biformis]|uniref:hypothetical protein n=1 Tax=Holdemanella biformis TaxID=1735 RepID=UPI0026661F39|nr:hypothetical protein [Holdemanella biformis]